MNNSFACLFYGLLLPLQSKKDSFRRFDNLYG